MNLLKYQKFLESNQDQDIHSICEKYRIKNYSINEDNSIDVDDIVNISSMELTKLPLKFRNVSGTFLCNFNKLQTLEGAPQNVGGHFLCSNNQLTSLKGSPKSVIANFYCHYNSLTTLEGCTKSVGGNFYCHSNQLTSLIGGPELVGGNEYYFYDNRINDLTGFPEFWEGQIRFEQNPISDILSKFPIDKVSKAIYWMNEFGVTHGGKINHERLEEVFITLGVENNNGGWYIIKKR